MDRAIRAKAGLRGWAFRAAAVTLALITCEAALQGLSLASPTLRRALLPPWRQAAEAGVDVRGEVPWFLPDARLWRRGNPAREEHDERGFHNPVALESASLVAIGDSHTYGAGLAPDERWVGLLEALTEQPAYNMGFPGWGPVEYLSVLEEALALKPETVVFGLYLGNDLFNCFRAVYLRGVETALADASMREEIGRAEARRPLLAQATGLFHPSSRSEGAINDRGSAAGLRAGLADHCKLYALVRSLKNLPTPSPSIAAAGLDDRESSWEYALRFAANHRAACSVLDVGHVRTILTSPYRLVALDLADPRIREGLKIAVKALRRAAGICEERGVRPIVVLLPTKESVFDAVIEDRSTYPMLVNLIEAEHRVRCDLTAALIESGIEVVDSMGSLQACFAAGATAGQPYPASTDGHPNATGHRAIARAIFEILRPKSPAAERNTASISGGLDHSLALRADQRRL